MTPYLLLIFIGIIGLLILLSIPIIIIWYISYICFFETSTYEISLYTRIHHFITHNIFGLISSPKSSTVIFRDKERLDTMLEGGEKVLYALHPHGLISQGRLVNMLHSSSALYPYFHNSYQAVHSFAFHIPLLREFLLLGKCIPAHESFLDTFIEQGHNISIFPGGVREIRFCSMKDGNTRDYLYLKRRKGFIRIALKHNMPVVPVLFWEDQQTFTYQRTPLVKNIEQNIKFITDYSADLGIFQMFRWKNLRTFWNLVTGKGEMRYVYVGAPIVFDKGIDLDVAHTQYITAIKDLYEFAKQDRESTRELVIT
jgi:hypothetical protein